jgi:sugar-specific transcriptional regulator TrmB
MERKEILDILEKFELSEYESRTYATLSLLGPSKAGILSKESKVPQSKIYEVLDQLMEKQLIEVFGGRPKEFKAIEPKLAFRNFLEEKRVELRNLESKITKLNEILKPCPREEVLEGVWMQKSEKWTAFFDRLSDMFERCDKYAYAITRDFSYYSRLRQAILKCMKKGIKPKIMGMGAINENNYLRAKWYHVHGVPIKIFETNIHPRILVIDGKEILIRLDHDPLKRSFTFHSIWSEDLSLVKVIDSYMKNLWNVAEPVSFKIIKKRI